ncbi:MULTISPECIES: hypothetical protein [Flavobacterium]|uniref:Uncharacterized protein n=1 Tax=Flavobacterium hankyongi TaxID=1176532 RepID=A0ABP8ZI83_9FLAO|nr:hypothetical protein [Flavobacterium sp. N1846]
MKKKLEAELISIAHRILKMKNKDDVKELHHEAQKLYEKLSVLLFVEENFDGVKPTIGIHEIESKLEKAFDFDEKIVVAEIKEDANHELTVETKVEEKPIEEELPKEDIPNEETTFEQAKEEIIEEVTSTEEEPVAVEIEEVVEVEETKEEVKEEISTKDKKQISFEELLGGIPAEPIFERIDKVETKKEPKSIFEPILETAFEEKNNEEKPVVVSKKEEKSGANLNDKLNKGLNIALNDRIAFEKNLFGGSSEDLNRVISQLNTLDSLEDAKNFIDEMVKPDYNNWEGKDEFVTRFMELVEGKFA